MLELDEMFYRWQQVLTISQLWIIGISGAIPNFCRKVGMAVSARKTAMGGFVIRR